MRKLLAILLCLCLSFVMMDNAAVAQGNGEPATLMPNTPLIVVDRTYLADDFSAIKPSDVIKVDTLNGAMASALFGARGANGVFLITTKKGKPGTKYAEQFRPYLSKVKYRSWVALNSKLVDSGLVGLNTSDIIKLQFSKKGVKSGKFTSDGHPLLLIVTKAYAIKKELPKATTSYKIDTIANNKVIYPANKGLANATTGIDDTAVAQTVTSTAKTIYSAASHKTMVLVNGQFYGDDIKNLNRDDIQHSNILASWYAESLFGSLNGGYPLFSIDTKQKISSDTTRIDSVATQGPLYIIDGKPIEGKPKDVYAEDIVEIVAIKKIFGPNVYPDKPDNGAIIIATRTFVIANYQKKLSAFSKKYKKRIEFEMKYNHNDKGIFYSISNRSFAVGDDLVRELYNIPRNNIKKVRFREKQTCCGINRYVDITLKDKN